MISLVQQTLTDSVWHLFLRKGRRRRVEWKGGVWGGWGAADTIIQGYTRLLSLLCHYRRLKPDIPPLDWIFIKYVEGERLIEKRHEHERRRKAAPGLFSSSGGLAEVQARCRCNARTHRQQIRGFLTFDEHVSFSPRRTSESAAGFFRFFFFSSVNFSRQLGRRAAKARLSLRGEPQLFASICCPFCLRVIIMGPLGTSRCHHPPGRAQWWITMGATELRESQAPRVTVTKSHKETEVPLTKRYVRQEALFSLWSVRRNKVYIRLSAGGEIEQK